MKRPVELSDVYPTLAELCGQPRPPGLQSRSLAPDLRGDAVPGPDYVRSMVFPYDVAGRKDVLSQSVITNTWRYTEWAGGAAGRELYLHATDPTNTTIASPIRHWRARVGHPACRQSVLYQDDFQLGVLRLLNLGVDAHYGLVQADPSRIAIVAAPGLRGQKAVCFRVPRAPDSFRAEISLPSESGFHERWYSERVFIPADWVADRNRGMDIVMQWHAIPGNWRATFPNLDLAIGDTAWYIHRSFGAAQTGPTRTTLKLAEPLHPGAWVSWVVHTNGRRMTMVSSSFGRMGGTWRNSKGPMFIRRLESLIRPT